MLYCVNDIFAWALGNWIEVVATLSGIIYIILSVQQNVWLWPVGFATSALFIVVFFKATLYADMGLQVYYLLVSFYGWYFWLFGKKKDEHTGKLKISVLKPYQWIWVVVITLAMAAVIYFITSKFTNASHPLWDGLVTAGSITATWMLARKIIDQWLVWIVVDGAAVALFLVKDLYFTAILTIIYTIMAIYGYFKWLKMYRLQEDNL